MSKELLDLCFANIAKSDDDYEFPLLSIIDETQAALKNLNGTNLLDYINSVSSILRSMKSEIEEGI